MAPTRNSPRGRSMRQSRPVRSNRTHVQSYNEESSSEDRLDEITRPSSGRSRRLSLSLRSRDSNRNPVSYREESTGDELEDELGENLDIALPTATLLHPLPEIAAHPTQSTPPRAHRNQAVKTRSRTRKQKRTATKRRLELGRPLNKRRNVEEEDTLMVGSGVIPPWQTLPYQILFDIFLRASYPLVDEWTGKRHSSVNWLLDVALLCRSFLEPALASLYHSPPLLPATKAHNLLSLLARPEVSSPMKYANKIQELHVDVESLLVYKSGPALGYFDLPKLVTNTPQVRTVRLYHNHDYHHGLPPWQIPRSKWIYPDALFTSMSSSSIRLHSWDWNARFMDTQNLLPLMLEKHQQPSFKHIRELKILHVASEDADGDDVVGMTDGRENVLAMALKELTDLRRLEFLGSSILNDLLLPNLPSNLTSLTINECDDVTTLNLRSYLSSHGHNLRKLNLSHNRHLSLSFVVDLKEFCPTLEKFTMDIQMRDWSSFHDQEPHFEELLSPSEVPTWPMTLQKLELVHLRKWNEKTAEAFFASLIEAAPELPNLRRLVISAILKTGWRDRASFRERWIGKLEKVFLRQSTPPTLRALPQQSQQQESVKPEEGGKGQFSSPSKRKSARIAQLKHSDGEDDHIPSPRSHRIEDDDSDHDPPATQGMCDVVMIRIDNQRPTEMQFNEEDFLDDELSGDEDWNGYDVDIGDGEHAW